MDFRERLHHVRELRHHASTHPSRLTARRLLFMFWSLATLFLVLTIVQAAAFQASQGLGNFLTAGPDAFPLLATGILFLLTLSLVLIRPERLLRSRVVALSWAWTGILLLALVVTWLQIDHDRREIAGVGQTVQSQADVDRYLAAHALGLTGSAAAPIPIPTGIFVESVALASANQVQISAFIWQHYGPQVPDDVLRGFSLPGAVTESVDSVNAYTIQQDDGGTLLGWQVNMTLRQQRDYRDFPFDRHDVSIRLWPEVPDRRVVLVPDFASYTNLDPISQPGLSQNFVEGGWIPEHTFFSYVMNNDNVTFGFTEGATPRGFPELVFNLGMKRSFVEPFLDDMLLAIVVALLLFGVVFLNSQDMDRRSRFGITTWGVLATSGTLLFTVLTKHNQIRSEVTPGQIVYIEVLPIMLYVTILLVAANAIVLLAAPPGRFRAVSYEDNLLPNVVFWPALLGTLWVVTLVVFSR